MTIRTRVEYENALQALGICVSARIPVLIWGSPGEGKTAAVESASASGWHVETVIITHSEPSDFAGLPVVGTDGSVRLHRQPGPPASLSMMAPRSRSSTSSPPLPRRCKPPHYGR